MKLSPPPAAVPAELPAALPVAALGAGALPEDFAPASASATCFAAASSDGFAGGAAESAHPQASAVVIPSDRTRIFMMGAPRCNGRDGRAGGTMPRPERGRQPI